MLKCVMKKRQDAESFMNNIMGMIIMSAADRLPLDVQS